MIVCIHSTSYQLEFYWLNQLDVQVGHSTKRNLGNGESLSSPCELVTYSTLERNLHLIVHVLLLVELALVFSSGILVLLVLGHKVVHVGLSLGELHLVHTLTSVPVEEGLTTEHTSELLRHALPELLDCSGVAKEHGCHLETLWWDVTHGRLNVVGDPLDKVARVLVLDVEHLLVDLLGGHAATEESRAGEVATVTWVSCAHHVLGVEHLLGELGHGQSTVLLGATGGEWGEASEEEVETGEWNQVHAELTEVRVELTREADAAGHAGHASGAKVVQVAIGWGGELEGTEADVVKSLVVHAHTLVSVLDKLVDGEGSVVWLDDGVGHLGGWHDGECQHHTVWVLLANLGDQKCSHTSAGTTTKGVGQLEALEAIAGRGLLADDVEDGVDELSALGVVALGPVVTSTSLAEDKVVWAEELTEWASTDGVHGTGLEVHEDSAGYVAAACCLVVVDVDALELEIGVAMVGTGGVDTVLVGDHLPELGTDLVTALAALDVHELTHVVPTNCCSPC